MAERGEPIWINPYVGQEAERWREGWRRARARLDVLRYRPAEITP